MRFPSANAPGLFATIFVAWSLCAAAEPRPTRLRVTLGAETPSAWQGELRLRRGQLDARRPLSLDADAAAATWIDGGVLRIDHRTPRKLDALDLTAIAEPGDTLELRLVDAAGEPLTSAAIDLDAARLQPQAFALGDTGRWVRVERPDVDRMRITSPLDARDYRPGEELTLTLRVEPRDLTRGDAVDLIASLTPGRSGDPTWRSEPIRLGIDETGGADATVTVPLPSAEGVATITLTASEPSGYRSRFMPLRKPAKLLQRQVQVLVVDRSTRAPKPTDWSEVYAYDPRTQSWADRAPRWVGLRRLPWFTDGPASNVPEATRHADRVRAIRLPPATAPGDANWVAYPLPIGAPGEPHAIEIDQLGEPGSRLTLALLEPDALGDLRPVGVATSHTVPRWNQAGSPRRVRVIAHPRTDAPLLVVANPGTRYAAEFGAIRTQRVRGNRGPTTPPSESARGVNLLLDESDLSHAVGASHAPAESGRHEVADLLTHWETARRLADRVEAAGATGATIRVNGRGAAIYPSELWTSARHDLGVWDDASIDAPRPSLLRVVAIEFDRRGLRLTPLIAADAASPGRGDADAGTLLDLTAREIRRSLSPFDCFERIAIRRDHQAVGDAAADADPAVWYALSATGDGASPVLLPASGLRWGARPDPVALLAASDAGVAVCRPHGVVPPPGVATPGADESLLATVRDAVSAVPAAPITFREATESLRLVESGLRLRRPDGVRSGDVRLLAATSDPATRHATLIDQASVADAIYLGGATACGASTETDRSLLRLLAETAPTAGTHDAEADVAAWLSQAIDGRSRLLVANRTSWPREATVTIDAAQRCLLEQQASDGGPVSAEWLNPGRHALPVSLGPGEALAWKAYSPQIEVAGVAVRPSKAGQRELAAKIAALRSRDTATRRPTDRVANGSFELPADTEPETANQWSVQGAVVRSDAHAEHGEASLRLRSASDTPAVAEAATFANPPTGRLVVRLGVFTESASEDARLRIELVDPASDYQSVTELPLASLTNDGSDDTTMWREVLLPVSDLPPSDRQRLTLRLTLTGDAVVHVDGVGTEDTLLPLDGEAGVNVRADKLTLLRLLTAAETALADGRLAACQRLLDGPVARYVLDHFPPLSEDLAPTRDATPLDAPAGDADDPNVADRESADNSEEDDRPAWSLGRVRDYLPGWWR